MVRRSRLEMYFDVLEIIDRGFHKPTRIMYRANLSWTNLNKVLDLLSQGGMIRTDVVGKSTRYHLTERGKEALEFHIRSREMLETPLVSQRGISRPPLQS